MDFFGPSVTLSSGAKVLFLFGGGGNGDGACIVYRFRTQSSIRECVFRLRDQEGMGIISGASRAPQGQVRSPTGAANQFGQDIEPTGP